MKTLTKIVLTLLVLLVAGNSFASPKSLEFDVALSDLKVLAGAPQKAYLNINITGLPNGLKVKRPQTNIAFVLDRSGSMSGIKLMQAKQALEMAISRLNKDDVASLIVYDDEAQVLWPAATMQNPAQLLNIVRSINTGGSTALFAGVTQGSYEVKKFLDRNKVNRVILLSDGMANIGPSKPHELAELGRALIKQGIGVSTIGLGLGYNEDLMTQLAGHSDGNHYFVEDADKLSKVFDSELGDIFSVVAQDIDINIICKDGVKPLRILGRDENVSGQTVNTRFSQIYGNQQRYLTVELMIPEGVSGNQLSVADVEISYNDSTSQQKLSHRNDVAVTYTDRKDVVEKSKNTGIYDNVSSYEANELSKKVVQLRDKGLLKEAKELQAENISNLSRQMSQSDAPERLQEQLKQEEQLLDSLDDANWNKSRKMARERQHNIDMQKKRREDYQKNNDKN
ncbi:MAG TPA: VWA domain-containing protein [Gammaproteobacteria bacterium]|nr:VWA domain-containing protein [Xanthomonadales bacterium]HOP22229.1 VWA domain-containing protein [Gammaproteobacteria bacterium]HPI96598.1 VWA domain-containing protein [Gammaproteobacteria bacterium]HPQ87995.1 VWA domain-containing protein [Gammaproteobacteria bacterium]